MGLGNGHAHTIDFWMLTTKQQVPIWANIKLWFEQESSFDLSEHWITITMLNEWCVLNTKVSVQPNTYKPQKDMHLRPLWFMMLAQQWGGDMGPFIVLIMATLEFFDEIFVIFSS